MLPRFVIYSVFGAVLGLLLYCYIRLQLLGTRREDSVLVLDEQSPDLEKMFLIIGILLIFGTMITSGLISYWVLPMVESGTADPNAVESNAVETGAMESPENSDWV